MAKETVLAPLIDPGLDIASGWHEIFGGCGVSSPDQESGDDRCVTDWF